MGVKEGGSRVTKAVKYTRDIGPQPPSLATCGVIPPASQDHQVSIPNTLHG